MRNLLVIALVAVCFTFPGKVEANPSFSSQIEVFEQSGEIDPALIETIIRHIQQEYAFDYECLCYQYDKGEMTIEKSSEGYLVTIQSGGGGILLILEDL